MNIAASVLICFLAGIFAWGLGLPASVVVAIMAGLMAIQATWAWARLAQRIHNIPRRAESATAPPWWTAPIGASRDELDRLGSDAIEGRYERVHSRLRWLGLTELWAAIHRNPTPAHFDERILRFVRQESGFDSAAILHLNPRSGEISGSWQIERDGRSQLEPVRWPLSALGGAVADALRATRAAYSDDAPRRALIEVRSQRPATIPQRDHYVVLPLLSQIAPATCLVSGWLHRPHCDDYLPHAAPTPHVEGEPGMRQCLSCRHYPVLGVLAFQRDELDKEAMSREAHRLEPLATTVSALLEHRQLHQRLVAEDRLREGMLDAMWNGLVGTDARGRIHFSNRRARELALTPEWQGELLSNYLELPEPDALGRALVEGIPYAHSDAFLVRPTATEELRRIPIRVALNPIAAEAGSRPGIVCVFEDRSHIQALESEIRHLDTLAAMGRFASALAHEIRNPLAGIQAGISYMRRQTTDLPDGEETLSIMEGEIDRLDGILQSLLSVARPREIRARPCEVRSLCTRVAKSFGAYCREQDKHIDVRGEPCEILADEAMLHQVILNLVKNALEASPPLGLVRIGIQAASPGIADGEARGLHLWVEDSGPGLDPEQIPQLFEPFYTQKAQGSGLGLYVCHNFVQRHGGRLTAENIADGGARFTIELPAVPALIGG